MLETSVFEKARKYWCGIIRGIFHRDSERYEKGIVMKKCLKWFSAMLVATLCLASCSVPTAENKDNKDKKSKIEKDDADDGDYDEDSIIAWKNDKAEESIKYIQTLTGEDTYPAVFLASEQNIDLGDAVNKVADAELTGNVYVLDMSDEKLELYQSHFYAFQDSYETKKKISEQGFEKNARIAYQLALNPLTSGASSEEIVLVSSLLSSDFYACDMVFENELWLYETDQDGLSFCIYFFNYGNGVVEVASTVAFYGSDSLEDCFDNEFLGLDMDFEKLDSDFDSDYEVKSHKLKSYSDDEILDWKTEVVIDAWDDWSTLASDETFIISTGCSNYLNGLEYDFADINLGETTFVVSTTQEALTEYSENAIFAEGVDLTLSETYMNFVYKRNMTTNYVQSFASSKSSQAYMAASNSIIVTKTYATDMDFDAETWIVESDTEGFAFCVGFFNAGDGVIVVICQPFFRDDVAASLERNYMDYDMIEIDVE